MVMIAMNVSTVHFSQLEDYQSVCSEPYLRLATKNYFCIIHLKLLRTSATSAQGNNFSIKLMIVLFLLKYSTTVFTEFLIS